MGQFRFFQGAAAKGAPVNIQETADEFVVPGISVMTEGPAEGHFIEYEGKEFQVYCDPETIRGVLAGAAKYGSGVKTKADHEGGIKAVCGYLTNFSEGKTADGKLKAMADWHVLKSAPGVAHLIEIVRKLSDTVGFSAFFEGPAQKIKDQFFARVKELYSVDFVTDPAANPSGIFSRKVDKPGNPEPAQNMPLTPEDHQALASACMSSLKPHLDSLHARLGKLEDAMPRGVPTAQTASPVADEEAQYSRFEKRMLSAIEGKISASLQDTAKTLHALGLVPGHTPPPSPSDSGPKDPEKMTFSEILDQEFGNPANERLSDSDIVRKVTLSHPKKHRAALEARQLDRLPARRHPYRPAAK